MDPIISPYDVALTISSITPKTSLNPAGGNTLTIVGVNFPASLDEVYEMTIKLGNIVKCIPKTVISTKIVCETEPIITSSRRRLATSKLALELKFISDRGDVIHNEADLEISDAAVKTVSLDSPTLSPIALRQL